MDLTLYMGSLAVVTSIGMLFWAFTGKTVATRRPGATADQLNDLRSVVLEQGSGERIVGPIFRTLGARLRRLTPTGALEKLETKVVYAGMQAEWPVERVLASKFLLGAIALVFAYSNWGTSNLVLLIGLPIGAFLLPNLLLSGRAKERTKVMQRQLPDVLDQMTVSVEAGLGFDAALSRVVANDSGPLVDEFGRAMQDVQFGVPRLDALRSILERTDTHDLKHFILALGQAERLGMPLAKVLRLQAKEMRGKRRQRAEEAAMKTPVKLVFPLVLCILPSLFIVILGPAAIRISDSGVFG
jgi:tight adherence protein C